jgi:agmatinase
MRDIPTEEVYISFDIDFFEPYLCPSTGTPVPGGFTMQDAKMIINAIAEKKKIIGFDLNEVVPSTRVDGLVGAEILYHLCVKTMQSHGVYSF